MALLGVVVPVAVEGVLYASYGRLDAPFHWLTHILVGSSLALAVMALAAARTRRPAPLPLVWPVLGHLYAMVPDFLFIAGSAHQRWMDSFLGHISTHFVPGRNVTWYIVFLLALAVYLAVLDRRVPEEARA